MEGYQLTMQVFEGGQVELYKVNTGKQSPLHTDPTRQH